MRSDLVDIDVTVHHKTYPDDPDEGAWLVSSDVSSPKRIWVPKSQCEVEGGDPPTNKGTMTLRRSLAEEKGLV